MLDPEPVGIPVGWWIELTGFEGNGGGEESRLEVAEWSIPNRGAVGE